MAQPALSKHLEELLAHRDRLEHVRMNDQFDSDANRFQRYSIRLDRLLFDFSKNRIDEAALGSLVDLARDADVETRRDRMFAGEKINESEKRAVLHTALRNRSGGAVQVGGKDVMPGIGQVLERMGTFCETVRSGRYQPSGQAITDVVNIGIGGSDLGPRMAVRALEPFCDGPRLHFVSNIDPADLEQCLTGLDPLKTLVLVASKTFTTQETMANAIACRDWINSAAGERAGEHFAAISTNLKATRDFGIADERTFEFWDWVGGRFSVWSAVGLSLMMAIGPDRFEEFLEGGNLADNHFRDAPLNRNIPVIMGLLGVWYRNIWQLASHAVLPYSQRLRRFPAFLQQLEMESNGKSVTRTGEPVVLDTAPVIWGEPGTNGQHAFFQLLHQGTEIIPCDFLVAANGEEAGPDERRRHRLLVANCLAQGDALMAGKLPGDSAHTTFEGNRPSNTLLFEKLDPKMLGMLVALFEHKVFVQGCIWDINSFDQWGVELGKQLAGEVDSLLSGGQTQHSFSGSTQALANEVRKMRNS